MVRESVVREWSRSKFRFNDERQASNPNRFFCQTILVPPPKLRPPSKMGDMVFEHPQNTHLCAIIQANLSLTELFERADGSRTSRSARFESRSSVVGHSRRRE